MSYDITMCDDTSCDKHEECYRYIQYQKYKKDINRPPYVAMTEFRYCNKELFEYYNKN